jgi:hypothetical protein
MSGGMQYTPTGASCVSISAHWFAAACVQKNGQQTGKGLTNMDVTVGFLWARFIPGAEALDRLVLLLR